MPGKQDVGMHEACLESSARLEEGLRCLEEDYRGNSEMLSSILYDLSRGLELLLKLTLWLVGEGKESIQPSHKIPKLLDQLLARVPSGSMPLAGC